MPPGSGPPPPPKCLLFCTSDLSLPQCRSFLPFCHWLIVFCLLPAASSLLSLYVAGVDRPHRSPRTNWASSFLNGTLPFLGLNTELAQETQKPSGLKRRAGVTNRAATSGTYIQTPFHLHKTPVTTRRLLLPHRPSPAGAHFCSDGRALRTPFSSPSPSRERLAEGPTPTNAVAIATLPPLAFGICVTGYPAALPSPPDL
ncbi:hypothetical protein VTG60DRAFT_7003 [Thermothelomyces hinnuleus]